MSGQLKFFNQFDKEIMLIDDLRLHISILSNHNDVYWLSLNYEGSRYLKCVRSLEMFKSPLKSEFEVELRLTDSVVGYQINAEEEVPLVLLNPQSKVVNFFELVRQEILLEEPLNPVSNPEKDFEWKDPELDQSEDKIDPRWSKLLELKKKKE
jgi:uncharacterized metal-binding protein YceD (DUF177 family)